MARKSGSKVNARGEGSIDLGFRKFKLKMTIGVMADLEDKFECDFIDIESHMTSTRAIAQFIAALARAAGEEVSDDEVEQMRRAPVAISEIFNAMAAVNGASEDEGVAPQVQAAQLTPQ